MDKNTFTQKVLECEETLYRVSMSILKNEQDCEDAVQDTILAAYGNLSSLRNEEYFKTWLVRILINNCNKQLKRRKRTILTEELPEHAEEENSSAYEVRDALDSLPPKVRIVMVMYYIEGFSVKEIKQILNIPEGTVKSRMAKGRKELSVRLTEK